MAPTLPSVGEPRTVHSKLMSARDAVREYVHDGDKVFLGYTTWATALEWEIARQRKQDLVPIAITSSAILPLAGCSKRIITAYLSTARSPWFMERFEAGEFQIEDYSNLSISLMLMAGALGLPFMPTRSLLGTDYLSSRYLPQPRGFLGDKKAQVIQSPFGGEDVVALPALKPDVSCVHVQWADEEGNAAFWGGHGEVKWALWASEPHRDLGRRDRAGRRAAIRPAPNDHPRIPSRRGGAHAVRRPALGTPGLLPRRHTSPG